MNKKGGHYNFILVKKKDSTRPKVILHYFCMSLNYIHIGGLFLSIWIYKIAAEKLKKVKKKKTPKMKTCITGFNKRDLYWKAYSKSDHWDNKKWLCRVNDMCTSHQLPEAKNKISFIYNLKHWLKQPQ